jgi:hypothetical protein
MKRILCALCFSLVGWQAWAGEVDDNLKKFEAALQKNAKTQEKTPATPENPVPPDLSVIMLPRLRECIAANNLKGAVEILQQLNSAMLQHLNPAKISDETKKATDDLLATLLKEQETRDKAVAAWVEETMKHATEAVKNAKVPTDLDPVLAELTKAKNQPENRRFYNEETQRNRSQIEGAYRFVARWQDFLVARAAQNQNQIRQCVRELASMEVQLMPRSEILAKTQESLPAEGEAIKSDRRAEEAADELVAKVKKLDDVAELIAELHKLSDSQRTGNVGSGNLQPYLQTLQEIDQSYHEYQTGLPINNNIVKSNNRMPVSVLPLHNQLILTVLPRYINAPAEVKPKPGEGVLDFLNRAVEEAKERGDIDLIIRARQALRRMEHAAPHSKNENRVLHDVQAARNQDAAGQYTLAVVSYESALKVGSDIVPVKWIGKQLDEIKKNHPAEYKEGMEKALNPAPSKPEPSNEAPDSDKDSES